MRVLGIDPGLENTGWGIIDAEGSRLSFVAAGVIRSHASEPMAIRLSRIDRELSVIVETYKPQTAAIEETFVNKNAASSLKLGQARGWRLWLQRVVALRLRNMRPIRLKSRL